MFDNLPIEADQALRIIVDGLQTNTVYRDVIGKGISHSVSVNAGVVSGLVALMNMRENDTAVRGLTGRWCGHNVQIDMVA